MKISLFIKLCIIILLSAQSLWVAAIDSCLARAWQGTLAKTPVVLEFVRQSDDAMVGHYYYRSKLEELLLEAEAPAWDAWRELDGKGNITGYFKDLSCTAESLSGEWHSPDGKTKLVLSAKPIKHFQRPRLEGLKFSEGKMQQQGALGYQVLKAASLPDVELLRFSGKTPAVEKLNQALRAIYLDEVNELLECNSSSLLNQGNSCQLAVNWSVKSANNEYLVLGRFYDHYWGGAYPESGYSFSTYNLQVGEWAAMAEWLVADYQSEIAADSPLGKLILKRYLASGPHEGCEEGMRFYASELWPSETGLQFEVAISNHAMSACKMSVAIPYASIWPFLSAKGRQAAATFGFSK